MFLLPKITKVVCFTFGIAIGVIFVQLVIDHFVSEKLNENLALLQEVKILCWIMITPKYHQTKGVHIKNTWGKRCSKLLFMSSENDTELGAIALEGLKEKKSHLWSKTKKAFQVIHDEYLEEADWFLKADDDTFMIMENLRIMLYQYNPKTALYFGQRMTSNESSDGFMQGGAYVLSKKAVQKFVKLYPNCRKKDGWAEDLYLGQCLTNKSIFVDTRDTQEQARFINFELWRYFPDSPNLNYWFFEMAFYPTRYGSLNCCSDIPAAFHFIKDVTQMYLYEFLVYGSRVFRDGKKVNENLPEKLTFDEILKAADVGSNSTLYTPHEIVHDLESSEYF